MEMRGGAHVIVLLGCIVWLGWSKNVTIDINAGNDTSTCGNDSTPCQSLDYVIGHQIQPINDSCSDTLSIFIRNGSYVYNLNGSDSSYQFVSCDQLNIIGNGSDVNVNCTPGAGFAFLHCTNVTITNVKFHHCGASQPGTSTTGKTSNVTIPVSTALYFAFCGNVILLHVYVNYSITSGVVMYNTGNLTVEHSHFLNNSHANDPENKLLSNGGFYIEFCYCDPSVAHDNCTPHHNTGAIYEFQSSYFKGNNALKINEDYNRTFYIPYKNDYFSFGRGGGLSIVFKGTASDNTVIVDDCYLLENVALWGGGVFVEFEDDSKNNSVTFKNTSLFLNQVLNNSPTNGTGGGGARIDFLHFNESLNVPHNNTVSFDECTFFSNSANHGGGLSLLTTPEQLLLPTNNLTLNKCTFVKNIGSMGAAMDLSTWHSIKTGMAAMVIIRDSNFSSNGLDNTDGAVYADCVPATFHGNILFSGNHGSALSVFGTGVNFTEACQVQFSNNMGWSGGAMSLLGNSYIDINPGVDVTFYNNSAFVEGGAIYALLTSRHDTLSSRNCFLQYVDETVHPNDWNATFTFINNYAPMGHSIYTTSLLPCAWGASYGNIKYSLSEVFKWTNFTYTPDDQSQISSGIASLSSQPSVNMDIAPGNITRLLNDNYPLDDWNHNTQGSVWLFSYNKEVSVYPNLTADYKAAARGHPGESAEVLVVTNSARNVSLTIHMTLKQCPPGYKWSQDKKECECSYEDWDGILYCDDMMFTSYLARGYWAGYILSSSYYIANESSLVTVRCPSQYCNKLDTPFRCQLPNIANDTALDHMICAPQNRAGTLCGNCTHDHGVAINVRAFQFNCTHCGNTRYNWLIYVASEFLPLTIFFIIILFFDINIHSGMTSSIILYFQVFDALRIVSEDELPPPPGSLGLIRAIQFLYNIWNLQFFGSLLSPYCLANHLNTMDVLLINYALGLFPFLLFFIVYLLKNLSFGCWPESERFRKLRHCLRRCWYQFKWRVAVKKSIISGLATVWTLTFTKLALISFLILSRTSLNADTRVVTYQGTLMFLGNKHLRYAIPAIIIVTIFVFIPATGLLCYPLIPQLMGKLRERIPLDRYVAYNRISTWLERPFIRLKPIVDCFQGSYRPRREFFAGLLFWYRLVIFIVFAYSVQSDTYFWNITFSLAFLVTAGIAQPFKKSRDNNVMLLSITNIIMISVLNIYLLDHYHDRKESGYDSTGLQWWQLGLAVLPLVFIIFYALWKGMKKVQAWRKGVPPEGLYVNFSSTYGDTPAEDPLLNFPAQIWDESETYHDEDNESTQDDYNYREGSNSASHSTRCNNHSTRDSSNRGAANRRPQSDSDRRRSQTFSGTPNTSYGAINRGSEQK